MFFSYYVLSFEMVCGKVKSHGLQADDSLTGDVTKFLLRKKSLPEFDTPQYKLKINMNEKYIG